MIDRLSMLAGRALTFRLEDLTRDEGQTTVEYAVVVVLVVLLAIAAFALLSGAITTFMGTLVTDLGNVALP
jgi:Flp pilus assembly pilin Flp